MNEDVGGAGLMIDHDDLGGNEQDAVRQPFRIGGRGGQALEPPHDVITQVADDAGRKGRHLRYRLRGIQHRADRFEQIARVGPYLAGDYILDGDLRRTTAMDLGGAAAEKGEAIAARFSERFAQERVAIARIEAAECVDRARREVEPETRDAHATRAGSDSIWGT